MRIGKKRRCLPAETRLTFETRGGGEADVSEELTLQQCSLRLTVLVGALHHSARIDSVLFSLCPLEHATESLHQRQPNTPDLIRYQHTAGRTLRPCHVRTLKQPESLFTDTV